jgi:hypothetical protein
VCIEQARATSHGIKRGKEEIAKERKSSGVVLGDLVGRRGKGKDVKGVCGGKDRRESGVNRISKCIRLQY